MPPQKIAISNLAFVQSSIVSVANILAENEIRYLEIAPTLVWTEPQDTDLNTRLEFKAQITDYGLTVIALQSLFFNKPELKFFLSSEGDRACLNHLMKQVDLCSDLGGHLISFGSPHTRKRNDLSLAEAMNRLSPVMIELANYALNKNVTICFEPVPRRFNCDFINTSAECAKLVSMVDHPNFRMLLDTGALLSNDENHQHVISNNIKQIAHVHLNDPDLFPPSKHFVEHFDFAQSLVAHDYDGYMTLEFTQFYKSLAEDIGFALDCYR